jgi:hypothetical protein
MSEKRASRKMTPEEIADSANAKLKKTLQDVFAAEAVKWEDIRRTSEPFWRAQQMGQAPPIRYPAVFIDEQAPVERSLYSPRYREVVASDAQRMFDEMGTRLRYMQERMDRLEAEVDLLLRARKEKRPEVSARKPRAYGNR